MSRREAHETGGKAVADEIELNSEVLSAVETGCRDAAESLTSNTAGLRSGVPENGFGPLGVGLTAGYNQLGGALADQATSLAALVREIGTHVAATHQSFADAENANETRFTTIIEQLG